MYQSIFELPTQVLGSLNEEDCMKWMTAYNKCAPRNDVDVRNAKKIAWHAVENAPSSFSFKAIASTDTIDKARDIIDLDTVKEHMDALIDRGGNIQNDHHNYTVGTIWDWKPCQIMVGPRKVSSPIVQNRRVSQNFAAVSLNRTRTVRSSDIPFRMFSRQEREVIPLTTVSRVSRCIGYTCCPDVRM